MTVSQNVFEITRNKSSCLNSTCSTSTLDGPPAGWTHLLDSAELLLHLVVNSLGLDLLLLGNGIANTENSKSRGGTRTRCL